MLRAVLYLNSIPQLYPWAWRPLRSAHRYPYLSQLIPTYTELYHQGISRDTNLILAYNFSIPTYPGRDITMIPARISHSWRSLRSAQRYPYYLNLSRLIPSYTIKGYPGIRTLSLHIPKQLFYSDFKLPGYPGISHRSGYPGITRYKSGFGRVSLSR